MVCFNPTEGDIGKLLQKNLKDNLKSLIYSLSKKIGYFVSIPSTICRSRAGSPSFGSIVST